MDVSCLSAQYTVRRLTEKDIEDVYALSKENTLFYEYCPPFVTRESILADMSALPPKKTYDDKYYVGFFEGQKLIAVMDLILGYPDSDTALIGLFMVDKAMQGHGIGSGIIEECRQYLKRSGYSNIRLGFAKGNPQSEAFWRKNGFGDTGTEAENENYTAVILNRYL